MTCCRTLLRGICLFVGLTFLVGQAHSQTNEQAMARWREARFGMFVHWGLFSVPAGTYKGVNYPWYSEWLMATYGGGAGIPRTDYEKFAGRFNPDQFNAEEWAATAKNAGMKYLVFTSKHHEGFSMFETQANKFNIVQATAFGRDPLAELDLACRRHGILFGVYYSIMDWHDPSQVMIEGGHETAVVSPKAKAEYILRMRLQLKELITHYHPAVLWFDGQWQKWWTEADAKDLLAYVRYLKPDLIVNDRVNDGDEQLGNYTTPEQTIPDQAPKGDWETCMTMNDSWGYHLHDSNWKSARTLIRNLVKVAGRGGNFLLNVGPDSKGVIPSASVARLSQMGQWLKINGESIYGTGASPLSSKYKWGEVTVSFERHRLYLHVLNPSILGTRLHITDRFFKEHPVKSARPLAAASRALALKKLEGRPTSLSIDLSGAQLDSYDAVIALDFD